MADMKFRKTRFLWVPAEFSAEGQRGGGKAAPPDMGLRTAYGSSLLLDKEASWEAVASLVGHYTIEQLLDVCVRISIALGHFRVDWSDRQKLILEGLCNTQKATTLWARAESLEAKDAHISSRPALFGDLQILTLAKVAFLTELPGEQRDTDWTPLVEALLMINDLVFNPEITGGIDTPGGRQEWHQALVVNSLFHHSENELHATARAFELYLSDRPHLRDHAHYVDLPALVEAVTGISAELLWAILFAFGAHWKTVALESLAETPGGIDRDDYFSDRYGFSADETDKFFTLVARDVDQMREEIRATYSFENIRPFHFLPFARWPLVTVGSIAYCVSLRLMEDKLGRGLHHLFLQPEVLDNRVRQRYLDYIGVVFEDYMHQLFGRAYPPVSGRYVDEQHLRDRITGKVCDGALLYGDAVVLVEAKAPLFTLASRSGESWSEYSSKLDQLFINAARQIENTVRGIEAGHLRDLGVDPRDIRHYFPLIVTLEDVPLNALIYEDIDLRIRRNELLSGEKIRPWQAIDVGELEFIEVAVQEGRSLRDLLDEKTSNSDSVHLGFGNYCYMRGERFFREGMNAYLRQVFELVTQRASDIFSERLKNKPER